MSTSPPQAAAGKRVVVVLGAHRGGTGAIARALSVLNLESRELATFNDDVLAHLGFSCNQFGVMMPSAEPDPWTAVMKARAIVLLKNRSVLADPRICRLLSFWKPVIADGNPAARYLIVVRNPISVVRSLEASDGIPREKGYFLWLQHMVPAMTDTEGQQRVVVDFDLLLDEPSSQLQRMARALDLPPTEKFPDVALRHFRFSVSDCGLDASIPDDVRLTYSLLSKISRDEISVDLPEVLEQFRELGSRLKAVAPVMRYVTSLESERDIRLAACQRQLEQFDEKLRNARSEVEASRASIDSLYDSIIKREAQVMRLSGEVAITNSTIASMASSPSWRLTSPLRKMKHLLSRRTGQPSSPLPLREGVQTSFSPNDGGSEFDAEFYLQMYPEVRRFQGGTPHDHFVLYGKNEGRLGSMPPLKMTGDLARLDPQRETVLVVSHEATATGAPVLSLNIIGELRKRYNVVSLLLGSGPILDDFAASADVSVGPVYQHGSFVFRQHMSRLLAGCRFKFAIVNSAASQMALYELARKFVPTVVLIHEFATSVRPRGVMRETVFWASRAVFSADIVREDAVAAFPDLSNRLPEVIPQGKCVYLPAAVDDSSPELAAAQVRRTLRPAGWPDDTLVVIGVGSIQMRKGIDLFVSCAARVMQSVRCRFIWIGAGYRPETDTLYSLYLEDQVKRAGLAESFTFMNETSRIDVAYEKADLLVLSSRLDPLPNVCIDAMSRGLPFVCFDKTTGIADVLRKNGLETECIAPYLDVEKLALLVVSFLKSPELRQDVGRRLREVAKQCFDMAAYVDKVEKIASACVDRAAQEGADYAVLAENAQLDIDYLAGPVDPKPGRDDLIRAFVRSWASGFSLRKPFAGFHPGIYAERCGIPNLDSNPLAHYLKAGSPAGPWAYEVIGPSSGMSDGTVPSGASVALHLHVFYPDLAPVILERLNANRVRPDLFISVPSEAIRREIEIVSRSYEGRKVEIQVVPNRGRDIGPLLTAFGARLAEQYEFIGHLHTKKTADVADSSAGEIWFSFLLENLIGGKSRMADGILRRMSSDPTIGVVFPDDPHAIGWSGNRASAVQLAAKMKLREPTETYFNFPVGTMFWARSAALRLLIDLKLDWADYPSEPLPYDGSMLHAIERLIPFVSEAAGFRAVTTRVPGVIR